MSEVMATQPTTATPEQVWAVVTDLDQSEQQLSAVQSIQRLDSGTGFGVGTRWRETRTMFGRSATEDMEVTALEPGRSYTVEADSAGAHYVSTVTVEPDGDGAIIGMSFAATTNSLFGRIMAATIGRLFLSATRKAVLQDLRDIAAAAERR